MVARLTRHPARNPAVRRHLVPMGLLEPQRDAAIDAAAAAAAVTPAEFSASAKRWSIADPAGHELDRLYASLGAVTPENHPRTARLLRSSNRKVAQKVIEEAGEVALAAVKHSNRGVIRESADLLYHLAVLWRRAGIDAADIWTEMRRRAEDLGIAEKLPKAGRG
jgi:phosphoribosyl-ATP pyrophosphohydrolase